MVKTKELMDKLSEWGLEAETYSYFRGIGIQPLVVEKLNVYKKTKKEKSFLGSVSLNTQEFSIELSIYTTKVVNYLTARGLERLLRDYAITPLHERDDNHRPYYVKIVGDTKKYLFELKKENGTTQAEFLSLVEFEGVMGSTLSGFDISSIDYLFAFSDLKAIRNKYDVNSSIKMYSDGEVDEFRKSIENILERTGWGEKQ